jgi:hypothetical protein
MAAASTDKFRKGASNFSTTLGAGISDADTTIPLSSATGLPTDTAVTLTIDRVDANGVSTPTKMERVTGVVSGTDLIDSLRGEDGSSAAAHDAGAVVEMIWDGETWNDTVDNLLEEHNQDGTHGVVDYTALKQNFVTSTDGETVTFDLDTSNVFSVTLEGNRTLALSNADVGQCFIIRLVQDSIGSRTVTWFDTISWGGGGAPTLTTTGEKTDVFGFICTDTDEYDGFVLETGL